MGQDRQMQMVGVQNLDIQNVGNQNGLIVVSVITNQNANQNRNGNVVAAQAEGDLNEIEEVIANCILIANLQQASKSGAQTEKALVYDSDGSAEDITKGTSANTKFKNQSIIGKPPLQLLRNHFVVWKLNAFQSKRPKSSKTQVPPMVVEMNDLSNPVTSNSIPITTKANVVKIEKVITLRMFKMNHFKTSRGRKFVSINKDRASVRTNLITVSQPNVITKLDRLDLLHMDLYGLIRAKVSMDQYVLVRVDDYSRHTWVHFLRLKDKAPEEIKTFLKKVTVLLQPPVIINDREDIRKLGAKGDSSFFIGYSDNSCTYRVVYNRRTRKIIETMNVTSDELSAMAFEQCNSKPRLQEMNFG
nr:retrotransposon protein, putative, Ty1-copia subclass [Tanacetum cinerariifolium]